MTASKVYLKVRRVDANTVDQTRDITVSDIHDTMGLSGRAALMSARMRPIKEGQAKIAGPAVTAFCWPGDNLMMHRALYLAQPGDVLVIVCQAELSGAQWGDLAARYAQKKGLAGVVIQGCVRDVDQVRALGFPVWATNIWALHPNKCGEGFVNTPVICEGVRVCPGDLIVADGDGVVCIPRDEAPAIVQATRAKVKKMEAVAEQVLAGTALWDLTGAAEIYADLQIQEIDATFED